MSPGARPADAQYRQIAERLLGPLKQRSYTLMQARTGQTLLDVGCGAGADVLALAELAGPRGRVAGVDRDPRALAQARARAARAASPTRFVRADAAGLPFASGTFHAVRAERLFQHLADPSAALAEMVRVTRRGGWIVAIDTDWGTLSIDSPETGVERTLARAIAERVLPNGYAGRQLYRLFLEQRIVDMAIEMVPLFVTDYGTARQVLPLAAAEAAARSAGLVSADELARWHRALEAADEEHLFMGGANVVIVAGRKR
jgi:SAM-dependent methyltransferase